MPVEQARRAQSVRQMLHAAVIRNFGREATAVPLPPRPLPDAGGPYGHTAFTAPRPGVSPYTSSTANYADRNVETGPAREATQPLQDRPEADASVKEPFGGTNFDASKSADKRHRASASEDWEHTDEGWDVHTPHVPRGVAGNPYAQGKNVPPDRPTAHQSPSNFRFLATPYGTMRTPRQLSGHHASLATLPHQYGEIGMAPQRRFRNTYRLEPPPRDAENMDIPKPVYPDVPASVFVSPDVPFAPSRGGAYRL